VIPFYSISLTLHNSILQLEDTLNLARLIEGTGVAAFAVHGRTQDERPRHDNHDDIIAEVTKVVSIPVIAK
jgi:tRNA-dihydrouridine synthase 2